MFLVICILGDFFYKFTQFLDIYGDDELESLDGQVWSGCQSRKHWRSQFVTLEVKRSRREVRSQFFVFCHFEQKNSFSSIRIPVEIQHKLMQDSRVTKLGEFSPIRRFFSFGYFFNMTEGAYVNFLVLLFPQ
jgi:hypothetical protein